MGNSPEKRYVDADKLMVSLNNLYPAIAMQYSSNQIESQINQLIQASLTNAFMSFKMQLVGAIDHAAVPYDKCMLCVQRDSCKPEHPLGDNR